MKRTTKTTVCFVPGEYIAPGTEIALKKDQIEFLEANGALEPADKAAKAEPETKAKPKGKALIAAVTEAIGKIDLKNEEFMTASGKPVVAVVERVLGYDINEADRDAGWEALQKAKPDLFKPAA